VEQLAARDAFGEAAILSGRRSRRTARVVARPRTLVEPSNLA
jgi:hypothetical protein